jgi:predicted SAM-dependent methyltransferase
MSLRHFLQLDLRETLPFPDNSAALVYSEHFLEHLVYPQEVNRILSESLRILEPGGVFSIGVPDTAWPLQSYVNGLVDYFNFSHAQGFLPNWCSTRMHVINEHFRGFGVEGFGAHKYAYDIETLIKVLQQAGFAHIRERSFDPAFDSELRKVGTLYAEAQKPLH